MFGDKSGSSFVAVVLIQLVILVLILFPSGVNLKRLINDDFKAPYKAEIVHAIGIIPLVNWVVVWMDIPDGTNAVEVVISDEFNISY